MDTPIRPSIIACLLLASLLLAACGSNAPSIEEQLEAIGDVDYNFHVKPILSQNCFLCHGNDETSRKADLRLDLADHAFAPRELGNAAIVKGDAESSLLYRRISSSDPKKVMPPPESHASLSELEIGILKRWINQGAEYKEHWAFLPPAISESSMSSDSDWVQNEIDYYTLSKMEEMGLSPSARADRRTLLRRLSFDLTGLPASPQEIEAFLSDESEDAYEKQVDRFLASKHFGERMTLFWLDQARYSDTNGYSIDGGRHMWLWRDWVIRAYNENMPFDQFVIEQLAGDLLPDATEAQLVATGFHRNNMNTHEGGTIPEENLNNYVADRVRTTGEVFLGLSLGCAQCHDHKYDPISQKEYYQMYAFFNTLGEKSNDGDRGINSVPVIEAGPILSDDKELLDIKDALAKLQEEQASPNALQSDWENEMRQAIEDRGKGFNLYELNTLKVTTPNSGLDGEILDDQSVLIEYPAWLAAYSVSLKSDPQEIADKITGLRIEFYPSTKTGNQSVGHGRSSDLKDSFVMTTLTVSNGALPSDQVDLYGIVPFKKLTASNAHPDYPVRAVFDERRINGWSPHPNNRSVQHFTATFEEPVDPNDSPYFTAMLNFGRGDNLIPGHFKIFAMTGNDDDGELPKSIERILLTDSNSRSAEDALLLQSYFNESSEVTLPVRRQIENLEERLTVLSDSHSTMVMNVADEPRQTFILNRGQYDQPTDSVFANTPAILPPLGTEEASRLDLAKWIVNPEHPLTARVTVNRYWKMLFGQGLVKSSADFGSQGSIPTHPELLDWLAVEFVNSGWDVKGILKKMVMSETYRQSSNASKEALRVDPENTILARGPRFRLQAEFIRDAALYASGLLVDRTGGPSVNPYQPPGLWKEVSHYGSTGATAQVFVQDHGEKLYRKSMYTYWKRTAPPPSMATFDAPSREVCTTDRALTNTPLQALVMLNDPQFVEASRFLAQRTIQEGGEDAKSRIHFVFEALTGRVPSAKEYETISARLEDELSYFRDQPQAALDYLKVGEALRDTEIDSVEHAAWTSVASLILNLSETITKS